MAMQDVLDATRAHDVGLYELATIEQAPFSPVTTAVDVTTEVYGWRGVAVTKVLHRLRPHLVPLVDSFVQGSTANVASLVSSLACTRTC
jgi:hypothetical protein